MADQCKSSFYMVNFLRPDVYDDEGILTEEAPKMYEPGGTLEEVRPAVQAFLDKFNTDFPAKKMELVLFNDALEHLLRINRLTEMPRGSGLLVGVGGSGKQSLTRLSSYISRAFLFQITLTKQYNKNSFLEDMKTLYKSAGHMRKPTTFLFTESEIKDEVFLEFINSVLLTGDIPGLFAKDEIMAITADLRNSFVKERVGFEDTQDNLKQYFIDKVRSLVSIDYIFRCCCDLNNIHIAPSLTPFLPSHQTGPRQPAPHDLHVADESQVPDPSSQIPRPRQLPYHRLVPALACRRPGRPVQSLHSELPRGVHTSSEGWTHDSHGYGTLNGDGCV
jgi:hypothetical protein